MKWYTGITAVIFFLTAEADQPNHYKWLKAPVTRTVAAQIEVPDGYERAEVENNSFGHWLRHLPLKEGGAPVMLHTGKKKLNQLVHSEVVAIDTGKRDLQQCADAAIRLRAEYLFSQGRVEDIHFNFTNGERAGWIEWSKGFRPNVEGNRVSWVRRASADDSYKSFRHYLDNVFAYAGSYSLSRELTKRRTVEALHIGDVFLEGGFPGHAVIVVDMAEHKETGKKLVLLAQSYMPAQNIHILKNPRNPILSPWHPVPKDRSMVTAQWFFGEDSLYGFD